MSAEPLSVIDWAIAQVDRHMTAARMLEREHAETPRWRWRRRRRIMSDRDERMRAADKMMQVAEATLDQDD